MTIFDWLKQVTYIKDPWSSFNPYMLHRFISMYEPYIDLANYLQKFWLLTPEQIYLVYCSYLPENKIFAKYIKSTKPKANTELLEILADYFRVSTREVKQYLHILKEDQVVEILSSRGISEEEIKRLLNEKTTKASKVSKGV